MARPAAEFARGQSLIDAAVHLIGEQGSLDVSVKDIAARGVQRIAVTRAVCLADNIGATTKEFLKFLRG